MQIGVAADGRRAVRVVDELEGDVRQARARRRGEGVECCDTCNLLSA